jgi:hypothetical protein
MLKINKQDHQEWLENPVTQVVHKFLNDWADREGNFVKEDFIDGKLHTMNMMAITLQAGKARAWKEVSEVDYEEIEAFYEKEIRQDTD